MKTREHRYKILKVTSECIAEIMIDGDMDRGFIIKSEHDMPEDAEYIRCYHSLVADYFSFVFYHKSWDIVPEGEEYPVIFPTYHKVIRTIDRMDKKYSNWKNEQLSMTEAISCKSSNLDNPWVPLDFQSAITSTINIKYITEDKIVHFDNVEEAMNSGNKGICTLPVNISNESASTDSMPVKGSIASVDEEIEIGVLTDNSSDIIKKKWINVMGEDYPEPEYPHYRMFHISAHELLIGDFRDMVFNSNSSIRSKYNIPDGSECIRYYLDILAPRYHIIFSHESFGIWRGYSTMMKKIADGEFDVFSGIPRYDKGIPSTKFKLVPEEVFDEVLDKIKPVKEDALDSFLDKYSEKE